MLRLFLYLFFFACFAALGQDKIYLLDGSCKIARVLEVAPDQIMVVPISESGAPFIDANETIQKRDILLIEYKGGGVEVYNTPERDLVLRVGGDIKESNTQRDQNNAGDIIPTSFASLNTLALCNSDVSGFFERLLNSKAIGIGLMAAYNFNRYAVAQNLWIATLSNGKKNYDVGAYVNVYPRRFKKRRNFSFGMLIKYTDFNFTSVIEENTGTATNIKYESSKGSQLATIFTIGGHTYITKNIFIKTIAGIGGFNMRGKYREQFNYSLNQNRDPKTEPVNFGFLPKLYFGINLGFNL